MKNRYLLVVLGLSLFLPRASGDEKRPMTFEDVIGVKRVDDPKISPDGQTVLFVVTELELEKNRS